MDMRVISKVKERMSVTYMRSKMNYWADKWDLDAEMCPCDLHFNDWVAEEGLAGKTFYHFGTGTHHVIGIEQAQNGSGNTVFAVTASIEEYKSYIRLVTREPHVARGYLAYFGDIYLTNRALLPEFDAVTLFHLCEFFKEGTAGEAYGGMTDRRLLDTLTDRTVPGGHILFYTGSFAFEKASKVIAEWEKERNVERVGEFKSLLVYRKVPGAA